MTFEEILDQVIAMLQRRGRLAYRTLKLQFHLDEEALEVLKEELIEVHHLAVDHDGRMLVWAGEASATSVPPAPRSPQQTRPQGDRHPYDASLSITPSPFDAERRQLTVRQGKHAEAHELLAPVYGWFTEGFDTADLQEAKALLDALA